MIYIPSYIDKTTVYFKIGHWCCCTWPSVSALQSSKWNLLLLSQQLWLPGYPEPGEQMKLHRYSWFRDMTELFWSVTESVFLPFSRPHVFENTTTLGACMENLFLLSLPWADAWYLANCSTGVFHLSWGTPMQGTLHIKLNFPTETGKTLK